MGLITNVSTMLPYSNTAQKLRTYWAFGFFFTMDFNQTISTATTLTVIREVLVWLQHHILLKKNGLLDLLFAFHPRSHPYFELKFLVDLEEILCKFGQFKQPVIKYTKQE